MQFCSLAQRAAATAAELDGLLLRLQEEAKLLRGYKGPLQALALVERFMLEVRTI